jgi:hypothetical protein
VVGSPVLRNTYVYPSTENRHQMAPKLLQLCPTRIQPSYFLDSGGKMRFLSACVKLYKSLNSSRISLFFLWLLGSESE